MVTFQLRNLQKATLGYLIFVQRSLGYAALIIVRAETNLFKIISKYLFAHSILYFAAVLVKFATILHYPDSSLRPRFSWADVALASVFQAF